MLFSRLLAAVLACSLFCQIALAADAAVDVVDALHAQLIKTMKSASHTTIDQRYEELQPVLERSFDFQRMIGIAAGSYWSSADEQQQKALLDAFSQLSIMTYASRFNGYSGETFEVLGERPGVRDTVFVDTRLNRTDAPAVPITYVLAQKNGEWRIIDVLLDRSISELAVRKSEYNQVLRDGGTPALVKTLEAKTKELQTSSK